MIVLGRVVAPYGIQGWVHIHPFGDDPHLWGEMGQWWLAWGEEWHPYELIACKMHGKGLVASFVGVNDRTSAEALKGAYIGAPRDVLPETQPEEFYWADLIGLKVLNRQGQYLGRVTELISAGAHEVLCLCDGDGRERLLPFVAAIVDEVQPALETILVDWEYDW